MHRFYCPDIATTLALSEEESRHCVKVLRLAEGDTIEVVDGCGTLCECRITQAHAKRCAVDIIHTHQLSPHWRHQLVLAVAPTKHLDRMEWMVEKCVEMGVDRIVPLRCHNSERTELKVERLRKIAVAAMKQSQKVTLPIINDITPLAALLTEPWQGQRFIAYCDAELPREQRMPLARCFKPGDDVMVLIGPEGDFSPDEVNDALARGCVPVTLGQSRLRTETAAVMACAALHTVNQLNETTK